MWNIWCGYKDTQAPQSAIEDAESGRCGTGGERKTRIVAAAAKAENR